MCPHCTTALPNAVSGSVDRAKQGKRFTERKKLKSHADISNVQIGHRHSVRATHTHTHFPGFHYISPVYCCSAKYFWNLTHAQKVISQSPPPSTPHLRPPFPPPHPLVGLIFPSHPPSEGLLCLGLDSLSDILYFYFSY